MLSRRGFVGRVGGLFLVSLSSRKLIAQLPLYQAGGTPITVYKSSSCGCCAKWVDHLKAAGFEVTVQNVTNTAEYRQKYGVPEKLASCHTGVVNGYAIEGHVPADLIHTLLKEAPAVLGLAVPGMVTGSPGMEGGAKEKYQVIAFERSGKTRVYANR